MLPCESKILWEAGPPKVPNIPIKIPLGEFYLWILINNNTLKQQLFHFIYLNIRQILTNSYVVFCRCFKIRSDFAPQVEPQPAVKVKLLQANKVTPANTQHQNCFQKIQPSTF